MYEMNKLFHRQGACTGFSHSLFVSEIALDHCARYNFWYMTRAKIAYPHPALSNLYVYSMIWAMTKTERQIKFIYWTVPEISETKYQKVELSVLLCWL